MDKSNSKKQVSLQTSNHNTTMKRNKATKRSTTRDMRWVCVPVRSPCPSAPVSY